MSKTLLQLKASIFSQDGKSTQLSNQFVDHWYALNPHGRVIVRDFAVDPVPHLTAARFQAFTTAVDARNPEQHAVVAYSDRLINELRSADLVVIGVPMYNFGIPSTLKAYFDHIARAGETFRYSEQGPQGLLAGKRAYVFAARGGYYAGTTADTQSAYLRDFLRLIGITVVEFIYAEGLVMGDVARQQGLAGATHALSRIVTALPQTQAVAA